MLMSMKEELAEGESFPHWANIVGDILRCIVDKTHSVQDRIRMGARKRRVTNVVFIINQKKSSLSWNCQRSKERSVKGFLLVAFGKLDDNKAWTLINATPTCIEATRRIQFCDFLYCSRQWSTCLCEDLDVSKPKVVEFASVPQTVFSTDAAYTKYLVDMGGNLCMVMTEAVAPI
ncbi:hypothetical protein QQP08_013627 [Theobroma cacao]|nr:hypothetical protein QQP08_013627 [Theobroma cacao]